MMLPKRHIIDGRYRASLKALFETEVVLIHANSSGLYRVLKPV